MVATRLKFVLMVILICFTACSNREEKPNFGKVHLETSGKPEAQEHFLQGLAALHSFEYKEADRAFKKAIEIDPNFAMAYWGRALVCFEALGRQIHLSSGRDMLFALGSTKEERISKGKLPLEKEFLQSVEYLFGPGTNSERINNYTNFLAELWEKYPTNLEVASLYALAIQATILPNEPNFRKAMKSAGVIDRVMGWNPTEEALHHPGMLHYYIHALNDPIHSILALKAADIYGKIAPDAEHAVHMPSHIYVQLGMWEKSLEANINANNTSVRRMMETTKDPRDRSFHVLYWLLYSNLQTGRYEEAKKLLIEANEIVAKYPECDLIGYRTLMAARYIIETKDCFFPMSLDEIKTLPNCHAAGEPEAYSLIYAIGYCALWQKDNISFSKALALLNDLKADLDKNSQDKKEEDLSEQEKNYRKAILTIEINELEALQDKLEGKPEEALAKLKEASEIEKGLALPTGIASPVQSALELYGDMLVDQKLWNEASVAYQEALDRVPNNPMCLIGLARTALGEHDPSKCLKYYQHFLAIFDKADQNIPEVKEAKEYISKS